MNEEQWNRRELKAVLAVVLLSLALCSLLCGCGTAKISSRREVGVAPAAKPTAIYVVDFEAEPSKIKPDRGILPALPRVPGPIGSFLPPLPGTPKDPEVLARDIVNAMSAALVNDLAKAGLNARRLKQGEPMPKSGWLVRGMFTTVNQGDQLQRAMIGFGAGKTDLQVLVDINDLTQGTPQPFCELTTTADSGKAPGGAPMIVLGPIGLTARFVIASQDLDRNVKQTASKIAGEVLLRTKHTLVTKNDL
ncbi:MAG TPA: DUF4410 domain-containing protein [Verrucomicrobiae bacterium]|nr:DUF4410 domain-containing protein [Verrucomicrobiae bacterium]